MALLPTFLAREKSRPPEAKQTESLIKASPRRGSGEADGRITAAIPRLRLVAAHPGAHREKSPCADLKILKIKYYLSFPRRV